MATLAPGAPPAPGRASDSPVGADAVLTNAAPPDAPFALRTMSGGTLVLSLAAGVPFDALRASIRAVLGATPERFRGVTLRLDLGTRDADLYELRRLVHFLKDELGIHVVGVHCRPSSLQRFAEKELKLKVHLDAPSEPVATPEPPPAPVVEPVAEPEPSVVFDAPVVIEPTPARVANPVAEEILEAPSEDGELPTGGARILTIDGTVRSGAHIRFAGDVQVFGDVNPGAEIVASGNVLVFGALKGLAHAGCRGDDKSIILAFDMRATQVRIGKAAPLSLAALPERETRHALPEIAFISGGAVVIEPYRGRLPGRSSKESA